jgi:hypothetical protein
VRVLLLCGPGRGAAGEGFSRGGSRIVSLERYGSQMSGHVLKK